jgi:FkbM family methyltransferase
MFHHTQAGSRVVGLARSFSKMACPFFTSRPIEPLLRYTIMLLEGLHGNGSGKGWDLEGEVIAARKFITARDPVILDVGAHSGTWSRLLSDRLDHRGRFHLFEASPQNARNIGTDLPANFSLVAKAVSERDGEATFYFSPVSTDISSFYQRKESLFSEAIFEEVTVATISLDTWVKENAIAKIDYLKMDIEGHELSALHGARRSLEAGIINNIAFEFGGGNLNSRTFVKDFWELLKPLGYDLFRICPGGRLLSISAYYEDLEYFRGATNYIAARTRVP